MKIEVAAKDLQALRDIVWQGRAYYGRRRRELDASPTMLAGTKMIKRLNAALKKQHGHDCNGEAYL